MQRWTNNDKEEFLVNNKTVTMKFVSRKSMRWECRFVEIRSEVIELYFISMIID